MTASPLLRTFLILAVFCGGSPPFANAETLRILTIGNSFADDATRYLPEVAASQGVEIMVRRANLGGSDLARHLRHWRAYIQDQEGSEGRPYRFPGNEAAGTYSLVEGLRAEAWDFVTIQQVSRRSFDAANYEPDAGTLIGILREHAPQAEIVVHQTWAYREDHPWFRNPGGQDGTGDTPPTSQAEMHRRLAAAYEQLARHHRLRFLPVGDAFQIARQNELWRFRFPDPDFNYDQPPADTLPRQNGSLNNGWYWRKDQAGGPAKLVLDANHANVAGRYLGACVWFEVLTGRTLSENAWRPDTLTAPQAAALRQAAHAAVTAHQKRWTAAGLRPHEANPRYWVYPRMKSGAPVSVSSGLPSDIRPNVLHVEDDHLWSDVTARFLSDCPQVCHLGTVANGHDAIAFCRQYHARSWKTKQTSCPSYPDED